MKETGKAFAYIASAWRIFTSEIEDSAKLIAKLKEKGYVTAKFSKGGPPAAIPSRNQVLSARRGYNTEGDE
tara:strand:+ start:3356 stop:3568 length:213 start_codon:yes stop_codon:yes gene_type:complete